MQKLKPRSQIIGAICLSTSAIGGGIASKAGRGNSKALNRLTLLICRGIASVALLIFAISDWMIAPC